VKRFFARVAAACLALAAAVAAAQATQRMPGQGQAEKSDWELQQEERFFKETEVKTPPYFREDDLLEFQLARTTSFRFYVDKASISVGPDLVVRYTLVARSPLGAENVSYEGIHCKGRRHKVYALGQGDRSWRPVVQDWQEADKAWTRVLHREYFCPMHRAIFSAAEGIDALRRGGHPHRQGFGAGSAN